MYRIFKSKDGEIELLPDITNTPIWNDINETNKTSKKMHLAYILYIAISKRENYYQLNTPTPFGDTRYSTFCGTVFGILQASGMEEELIGEQIVIKKGKRRFLVIDKVKRPSSYYETQKENSQLLSEFGL